MAQMLMGHMPVDHRELFLGYKRWSANLSQGRVTLSMAQLG